MSEEEPAVTSVDGSFYDAYKCGAVEFLAFVRSVGEQGLASGVLKDSDLNEVKRGLRITEDRSEELFKLLGKIIDEKNPSFWDECTIEAIWGLLGGIFLVAQHSGITASAKQFMAGRQSAPARAAKAVRDRDRDERLRKAIVDEADAHRRTPAISTTFGDLVRPGVRARLGVADSKDEWPSSETIKDAVRRMKG